MAHPNNPSSPAEILSLLPDKFHEARQSGELFFFESTVKDVYSNGRRFNVRSCPALLDKAKAKTDALAAISRSNGSGLPEAKRQKRADSSEDGSQVQVNGAQQDDHGEEGSKQNRAEPFKPPYVPELYVGCLEGLEGEKGMSVLLNKYSLLPEHILLCPPSFQPQHLPPTPPQLALAYHILFASARHPTRPRRLLAFYNGGTGAGASQPWRHLQFIDISNGCPIEEWTREVSFEGREKTMVHPGLPYLHLVHSLPNPSAFLNFGRGSGHGAHGGGELKWPPVEEESERLVDVLAPALMSLLDLGIEAVRRGNGAKDGGWNLLMTLDHLHLIPRSAPSFPLPSPHAPLELNSLGYAGMFLVRSSEEEAALMESTKEQGLMSVLEKSGVPRAWGEEAVRALESVRGHEGWDGLA